MNNFVAIQGELGSFHHAAAASWFGDDVKIVPCTTFKDVFIALDKGLANKAVVAVENSLYGSINEVYDLLLAHKYPIVGEIPERIHQHLIGFKGANLQDITHVYSHTVALSQCSDFLDENLPTAKRVEVFDTAASVGQVKKQKDIKRAAIAGTQAAKYHEMDILKKDIHNHELNFTRFLVLDKNPLAGKTNKASLVIETNHEPGALFNALKVFNDLGINLVKLQSRPIPGQLWRYMFYIVLEANGQETDASIERLVNLGCKVINLGKYNKAPVSDIN